MAFQSGRMGLLFLPLALAFFLGGCQPLLPKAQNLQEAPMEALPTVSAETLKTLFPNTVGQGKPVIVDFYSRFCLACQQISPKLETLVKKHPAITLHTIDIQKPSTADKAVLEAFDVTTVPYVLFISGQGKTQALVLEDMPQAELEQLAGKIVPAPAQP